MTDRGGFDAERVARELTDAAWTGIRSREAESERIAKALREAYAAGIEASAKVADAFCEERRPWEDRHLLDTAAEKIRALIGEANDA